MREDCPYAAFGEVYLQQQGRCLKLEQVECMQSGFVDSIGSVGKKVFYCSSAKIITKQETLAW